jgi:hypothetical protein
VSRTVPRQLAMKTIFVQVKCDLGKAYEVAGDLYFITERIQRLPGIKDTLTTNAFKAFP